MYETGLETTEFGGGAETEWGRPWRGHRRFRRFRRFDSDEYGEGEFGEGEGEFGEGEGEYGESEYSEGEYGEGEGEYGESAEGESGEYGEGEYGEGEGAYGEGEERFLPFLPIIGKVLGGVLGGLGKEVQGEYSGEYGEGEYGEGEGENGEADEQFLGKILGKVLGFELEAGEAGLPAHQEQEFAAELMEVSSEQELTDVFKKIVNKAGEAVRGIKDFAKSPTGQAVIKVARPLAKAALPWLGGAVGSLFSPVVGTAVGRKVGQAIGDRLEYGEMNQEQADFELARRFVRLTAAAAKDAATAPGGTPPELVGEFAHFRAARRFARPLYGRAVRSVSPYARRYYGSRYRGFVRGRAYGRPYGRSYGGYRRPGRYYGYRGYRGYPRYGYPAGVPAPVEIPAAVGPEPAAEPPARPGYKWIAVPIDTPAPPAGPEPAAPAPAGNGAPPAPGGDDGAAAGSQKEFGVGGFGGPSGQWIRRNGKIIVLGA